MAATLHSGADPRAALTQRVLDEASRLGFEAAGVARLQPSDHAAFYRAWLAAGRHGTMAYLAREDAVARRLDPAAGWPGLSTAVVVTHRYANGAPEDSSDGSRGVIARYARGRDYHKVMKPRLLALLRFIESELGRALPLARAYVDTGPVLERELAQRAGLGWFGRNTMLIHPRRGSYFFLGSLLLELDLEADEAFEREHCGTCRACIDACPTGALLGRDSDGAPVMDARLCISYLTIENRGPIPRELRPLIGNRVFGCDICNAVCPWNGQAAGTTDSGDGVPAGARSRRSGGLPVSPSFRVAGWEAPSLIELMCMTHDQWDAWTRGKALRRAGHAGLRRNVAVALGNWRAEEAVPTLIHALSDTEPLVRGHVAWALGMIGSSAARSALIERRAVEEDQSVIEEIELALLR
jgi:epoxyqueuosine reductase